MRFVKVLNSPMIVLFILGVFLLVNIFLFYRYYSSLPISQRATLERDETSEIIESSTEMSRTKYLQRVSDIQNASVETLEASNDELLRYDALTAKDVIDLESNYLLLAHYRDQAKNLNPPKQYEYHYGAFSAGIDELYNAARIAYLLADDPVSATKDDFDAYGYHLFYATNLLEQSNQILGQDYKTTEELKLPTEGV